MAIKLPFKLSKSNIVFILSLLLNLLGGSGIVKPLVNLDPPPPAALPAE